MCPARANEQDDQEEHSGLERGEDVVHDAPGLAHACTRRIHRTHEQDTRTGHTNRTEDRITKSGVSLTRAQAGQQLPASYFISSLHVIIHPARRCTQSVQCGAVSAGLTSERDVVETDRFTQET